jgi:hypothetical protein
MVGHTYTDIHGFMMDIKHSPLYPKSKRVILSWANHKEPEADGPQNNSSYSCFRCNVRLDVVSGLTLLVRRLNKAYNVPR